MKFVDGYWGLREGVSALYPEHVVDVRAEPGRLAVQAAARRVVHRYATLSNPLIGIECSAPAPDVIAVRVERHKGGRRRPGFALTADPGTEPEIRVDERSASLTSGELVVRFDRGEHFAMEFLANGEMLTRSGRRGIGAVVAADGGHHVHEGLTLGVGEAVYGLGERFGPFVKNGQSIDIWNADGGAGGDTAYKNVPFYLTNRGYGVFVNDTGRVSFEVGTEVASQVRFSVPGHVLEYFVIHGPTPREVLAKYTALTGRPALAPAWSFGLWLSTSFLTEYDEASVEELVEGMRQRNLPFSVFHFDCFWMRAFRWCDFQWDPRRFPDPAAMLGRLKERGVRACVWISPHIAQHSDLFDEAAGRGYLLCRADGGVWQTDEWQSGAGFVDFTNPDARHWYQGKLRELLAVGVDCFKTDFGEEIPTDVVWFDGSDPVGMHNYYSHLYNRTVFELLREVRGPDEAVLFARSGTSGGQSYPVHWGGDNESTFESMAETLRGGLSLAASGYGFWSHDIGGFEGSPDPALFKRWVPFGLLSSHSRLHGASTVRVPWNFDDESVDIVRAFTALKHRLMPYLYAAAVRAHREGVPVISPMFVRFPEDPACVALDRQYMLGEDLLVAPVFSADGQMSYYVPDGVWTHVLTGETVTGPRWVTETHGFESLPLLAAPGAVIAWGDRDDRPDYRYADGIQLRVYRPAEGFRRELVVPTATGSPDVLFELHRRAGVLRVRRQGPDLPCRITVIGEPGLDVVESVN